MRSTVLFLLMITAYVFVSEQDYRDVERLTTHMAAVRAESACRIPGTYCGDGMPRHLAQNR